jgi:hypothetical protein
MKKKNLLCSCLQNNVQKHGNGTVVIPTLTRTYTRLPLCHGHTLSIVTDTHQDIDCGLYTYMNSYLDQDYRKSILIDKRTLCIDSWLIRLWVDNVLLINTRSLSILMDKPIPLSIGIPSSLCTCPDVLDVHYCCPLGSSQHRDRTRTLFSWWVWKNSRRLKSS